MDDDALLTGLVRRRLVYGTGERYASLLSPCSVTLDVDELRELTQDLTDVADLYRRTNQLYLASLAGVAPAWISTCIEYGLTPGQCDAHRMIARAGVEPVMTRVDYVEISPGRRQLAEVQWKSGGPGLLIGHQSAYAEVFPLVRGTEALGNLEDDYFGCLRDASPRAPAHVLNETRAEWLPAEAGLASRAAEQGWRYAATDRQTLADNVKISRDGLRMATGETWSEVTVLRGRGFTEVLEDTAIMALATATLEGALWIEAPLNFLYRQKWLLALPFIPGYGEQLSARLRSFIIPTALILGEQVDWAGIADSWAEDGDRIGSVRTLADVAELPGGLRRRLVLKCGAGVGPLQSGGKGVFRLAGSRSHASKTLDFVRQRVSAGEPWIAQPYRDATYHVPFGWPEAGATTMLADAHCRMMIFGGRRNRDWAIQGAIGNFAQNWKVSGSPARRGDQQEVLGSSFVDVRLRRKPADGCRESPLC